MSIIDIFVVETSDGKFPWTKWCFSLVSFFALRQNNHYKICHVGVSENPKVNEERWKLIITDIIDPVYETEDGVVNYYGAALDKEDFSG